MAESAGDRALTLVFDAVCSSDQFLLQEVLLEYPELDVNEAMMGITALHVAVEKGIPSCVTVLLSAGAEVDKQDEHGLTPLMTAIKAHRPLVINQLLRAHANTNIIASNSLTPLHFAARLGNNGVFNMLLAEGANPNVQALGTLESPLSIAVHNGQLAIVQTLLLGPVYVNPLNFAKSNLDPLPLMKAIESGNYIIAKLLVIAGYNSVSELNLGFKSASAKKTMEGEELDVWFFLNSTALTALPLKHLCRLCVRQCLYQDIHTQVQYLCLPQAIKDYIMFKDFYTPLILNANNTIFSYFEDIDLFS